ncbi:glycosyltransferase family 87 protein [Salinigranum halophilum]|uniref:glycosyltransferase family 87 protein n=1 Tax=Salinigranum halophilum TaxID=2565931 RepID=UPI0010A7D162|nr:glycosyltransferase family 87 protein [Salinigranum halophilum]
MFVAVVGWLTTLFLLAGVGLEVARATDAPFRESHERSPSLLRRLGAHATDRPRFVVAALGLAVVLLLHPFVDGVLRFAGVAAPFEFWDFGAYTGALDRWRAGESLYVRNEEGGYSGTYLYPPVFLLVVWPFTQLPFDTGAAAWELCSVLFLWGSLQLLVRQLGYSLRLWERALLLWALVGFHPLLFSVKQGQISAFLGGLVTLSLVGLLSAERPRSTTPGYVSGACTGLVGVVKLVYAPIGAHLLTDRRRFLGALGAGVTLFGLSLAVFGVEPHVDYLDVLRWGKSGQVRSPLLWMAPYYRPLYALAPVSFSLRIVGSLVVAGLALAAASTDADRVVFALGVATMPLLAPQAYSYYLTALVPAVVVMLEVEFAVDGRPWLPLLAVFLLHSHSFGLRLAVEYLPPVVPFRSAAVPGLDATVADVVVSGFQPGVWGALLLGVLAAKRVVDASVHPLASRDRVR